MENCITKILLQLQIKMKTLGVIVLALSLIGLSEGLKCYKCDNLQVPRNDCPGWRRKPIDTVIDYKDKGGLYTNCVDVRLTNGTVLYQDAVPLHPTCGKDFIDTWRTTVQKKYNTKASVICCTYDRCNGPNARAAPGVRPADLSTLLILASTVILSQLSTRAATTSRTLLNFSKPCSGIS